MPPLLRLKRGTRFRVKEMPEVTGTLVKATEARAVVRLDAPQEEVEFVDGEGETRRFTSRRSRVTSWTAMVNVVPIGFESIEERESMSKSKTAKAKAKAPAAKKAAAGKMSCLDAAAKVLGEKKEAMTTAQMIEAMAAKGYWTSPGGKTPAATLYSAILRELGKGKESRFKKASPGHFTLSGNA